MDDVLAEIKSKIDIVDLVSSYVSLKKSGRNYKASCPFHSEKTPSFMVSPELQIYKCFGCQAGGDIFSFVMKIEGLEFNPALKTLAERAGVKLKRAVEVTSADRRRERIYEINHLASQLYHYLLTVHKVGEKTRQYLKNRALNDTTVAAFFLGYAPSSWDALSVFLIKRGYTPSEIIDAGLAVPRKKAGGAVPIYDRFRGRLMFPLKDSRGRVLGFSGRVIDNSEPKYLNSPETPIFKKGGLLYGLDLTKQEIKKADEVLIVEGQFDLITPYQEGFRNLVATLGTALTDAQLGLLSRFTKRATFLFDRDTAGSEATIRSIRIAENLGFTVSAIILPSGVKDPDESVRKDKEAFSKAIKKSIPFYDYYLSTLIENADVKDIRHKKTIAAKFLNEIGNVESPITRAHYLDLLAKRIGVDRLAVEEAFKKMGKSEPLKSTFSKIESIYKGGTRGLLLQRYLISLLMLAPRDISREVVSRIAVDEIEGGDLREIYFQIKKALSAKKAAVDAKNIRDKLVGNALSTFEEVCLFDLGDLGREQENLKEELEFVLRELKREAIKREISDISLRIKEAERSSLEEEVMKLQKQLQKAAEKLK